jgi:hypothetical protein
MYSEMLSEDKNHEQEKTKKLGLLSPEEERLFQYPMKFQFDDKEIHAHIQYIIARHSRRIMNAENADKVSTSLFFCCLLLFCFSFTFFLFLLFRRFCASGIRSSIIFTSWI